MKFVRALPNNWEITVYVFVTNATKFLFFLRFWELRISQISIVLIALS